MTYHGILDRTSNGCDVGDGFQLRIRREDGY
jgi:hypothetical protein